MRNNYNIRVSLSNLQLRVNFTNIYMKSNLKKLLVLFTTFSIFGAHDFFGMKTNVKDLQNNCNLNANKKIEIVKISNPIKCNYRLKRDGEDLIDFIKYRIGLKFGILAPPIR